MQLFCFYFAIGANPKGLRIGIVSKELVDFNDCHNSSLITTFQHDYTCDLAKVSCRFISSLNDSVAIKVCLALNIYIYLSHGDKS